MIDKSLKIHDEVCTGCSACTEACYFFDDDGVKAIQLVTNEKKLMVPRINNDICVSCMLCYKACPVEDRIYHNDAAISFAVYQERMGASYYGYSLDQNHRFEASTAGIVTEIASYLLDTNQVDGVVSSYQRDDNNQVVTRIITDSKAIKNDRGSIYRQVPALNGLAEKVKEGNYKKILLIGLPCHVAGLKALLKVNKRLRKTTAFVTIALFCKQTKTDEFSNIERLFLGAKKNQKITYRGTGWPGLTRAKGAQSIPFNDIRFSSMWGSYAFTPEYCFSCTDPLGIESDISVGDAWLKIYQTDKKGSSLLLANSQLGQEILLSAFKKERLYLNNELKENIIKSQNYNAIKFKINSYKYTNMFYRNVPEVLNIEISGKEKTLTVFLNKSKTLYEILYRRQMIRYIPKVILKLMNKTRKYIFDILS